MFSPLNMEQSHLQTKGTLSHARTGAQANGGGALIILTMVGRRAQTRVIDSRACCFQSTVARRMPASRSRTIDPPPTSSLGLLIACRGSVHWTRKYSESSYAGTSTIANHGSIAVPLRTTPIGAGSKENGRSEIVVPG